jgi:hypothetical protein
MPKFLSRLVKLAQIALVAIALLLIMAPSHLQRNIKVQAKDADLTNCKNTLSSKQIKFSSLFNLGNFLPLLPESCGIQNDGTPQALPISYIFDVIIRGAGLLFSLAFYMLPIAVITFGARALFLPFDFQLNKSDFTEVTTAGRTITRVLGQILVGIVVIIFSYTIVFTILGTLQIESSTDLGSFFTL